MALAISMDAPGGPNVLQVRTVDVTAPGPGQVRLTQHACGLNYIDTYHRSGLYKLETLPAIIGMEGAGVVSAVGANAGDLRTGDRVAYAGVLGGYASERLIAADRLVRLPADVSFETAASMMLQGMTVRYLFKETYPVTLQTVMLFHAAAGGVGLIACQWARTLGLQLIATAGSDAKCALALANGASYAINYVTEDFVARVKDITGGKGVSVVYDSVGKDTFLKSLDCLSPFGLAANFGNASGKVEPLDLGLLAAKGSLYVSRPTLFTHIASRESTQAMADDLFAMVASGRINIPIDQTFALADVAAAHRALEARKTTGCTILTL